MSSRPCSITPSPGFRGRSFALVVLVCLGFAWGSGRARAASSLVLWDTGARWSAEAKSGDRANWKAVPRELLQLEADPAKAKSDPGYYGREYVFTGDAVVENERLTAVFASATGKVWLWVRDARPEGGEHPAGSGGSGARFLEIQPLMGTGVGSFRRVELVRNAADDVALAVTGEVAGGDAGAPAAVFVFGRTEVVEIRTVGKAKGVRMAGPIERGIVPGFLSDDLVISPDRLEAGKPLWVPAEGVFLGLMRGGREELVLTWPRGAQRVRVVSTDGEAKNDLGSVEIETDGRPVYVAGLAAPGLWHRQEMAPKQLETDVVLDWKRPFSARWKTQLQEGEVRTTFVFHEGRGQIWRGVPGSYQYPVWFEGDAAMLRPSKKVPPRGECLVYFVEGQETPAWVTTPVDVVRATLGRAAADELIDVTGRKLRTHHRRAGDGVRRACTCGCTEAIQAVFEAGEEVERKESVRDALDDMIYFVRCHVERIDEYRRFAAETTKALEAAETAAPALADYVGGLKEIVGLIPQECTVQAENMKSPGHAEDLARRTLALTDRKAPENLKAYMELLKAWRDMGGAQDYVVAQCHGIARRLFQEAGYAAMNQPEALELAAKVRQGCRRILRNPDGYEIWAEY